MGYYQEAYWLSEGQGQTRAERKSGAYRSYIPTQLAVLKVQVDTDVVADIVKAEKALQEMNGYRGRPHDVDGLARFLIRAEAISSSYIEGLQMGSKRLMQAELNEVEPRTFKADPAAVEIVSNIQALRGALDRALESPKITLEDIISIHRALLGHTPLNRYTGTIREKQNWIGGNSYNPLNAVHIPPAPEHVRELMNDLLVYCNRDDISPVQQTALVHAQFETIHPFVDGNGRTGRALIHLILRRRGLLDSFVPPISLILATYSQSYIAGLNSVRFEGEQPREQELDAINEWLSFFAGSCVRACDEIVRFAETADAYEQVWRDRLGKVRKNSTLDLLLGKLIGIPVFTINSAARITDRSYQSVNLAVEGLVEEGIVKPLRTAKRNRAFEVTDALDALRAFERRLASTVP